MKDHNFDAEKNMEWLLLSWQTTLQRLWGEEKLWIAFLSTTPQRLLVIHVNAPVGLSVNCTQFQGVPARVRIRKPVLYFLIYRQDSGWFRGYISQNLQALFWKPTSWRHDGAANPSSPSFRLIYTSVKIVGNLANTFAENTQSFVLVFIVFGK